MTCTHPLHKLQPASKIHPTGTAECDCGAILSPDEALESMKGEEVCPTTARGGGQ